MTTAPKTPQDTSSESELDESSLSAIRSLLTEEAQSAPRETLTDEEVAPKPAGIKLPRGVARLRRKADDLPLLEEPAHDPEAAARAAKAMAPKPVKRKFSLRNKFASRPTKAVPQQRSQAPSSALGGLMDRVRAYRPTRLHIILAVCGLVVFMRPWLILGLMFIFVFIMVGVFLITGYDGFWQAVMKISRWYASRRPDRAASLHARLDRFAVRWDAVLDRFPEGTVDALYLPDFGDLATAELRHDEAMERRLASLQEKGA